MAKGKLSTIFVIVLLAISGFFSWQLFFKSYNQEDTVLVKNFPREIAGWTSQEIPLDKRDFEILETHNLFVRTYTSPDKKKKVMLYIIYSQTNRKVSHPPEMCFVGSGMLLLKKSVEHMDTPVLKKGLNYNRMYWKKGEANQLVYNWYKAGDDMTASYWGQQAMVAFKDLLRQNASTAMIRLSTPYIKDGDVQQADTNLQEFTRLILPLLPKYIP